MKKILIVDDDRDVLAVLEQRLGKAGYEVIKASSGQEAIEKVKIQIPDLILLDLVLPDIDGGAIAQEIRQDAATKNIPIIFLTCLVTKDDEKRESHLMGNNFFVAKPYDHNELLKIIREHIK